MAAPSIRRRLALAFFALLSLFAINQAINLWGDHARAQSMSRLDQALRRVVLIASIRQGLSDLHKEVTLLSEIRFEQGGAAVQDEARLGFEAKLDSLQREIDELAALVPASQRREMAELGEGYSRVAGLWRSFYENLGVEPAWAVAALARADPVSLQLLSRTVPQLQAASDRGARVAKADFEAVTRRTNGVTGAIFVLSVAFGVLVAVRLSRYLVGRLADLRYGADVIGDMNLQHRIAVEPRDEMGDLADHFNRMAGRLHTAQSRLTDANRELAQVNRLLEQRIEEELAKVRLAARIQRDLLPKEPPAVPGYDLAGRSIPAQEVGGDYFDFIPMDDGRLALCLADVSGKGLPASLLMANLQACVRGQALGSVSAAECLRRSNTLLYRNTDIGKFVTAFYAILDPASHRMQYCNAGHNPPLLFRAGGGIERLETGGTVLGILEGAPFGEAAVEIGSGDLLVLYSDGVTEARNLAKEEFDESGVVEVVRRHRRVPAANLLDALVEATLEFTGDQPQFDDITVLVARRL